MCKSTFCKHLPKIENLSAIVKKNGASVQPHPPSPSAADVRGRQPRSSSPAFNGAKFSKSGHCLKHPDRQLVKPMKDDVTGKLIYQELKANCPSCQTAKHKSRKNTSLGGGKVRTGHRSHGYSPSRSRSKSRERGEVAAQANASLRSQQQQGSQASTAGRSRSKSRDRSNRSRQEYDTPFDNKGRCHYHKNVQLAAKQQFGGGWKVLQVSSLHLFSLYAILIYEC